MAGTDVDVTEAFLLEDDRITEAVAAGYIDLDLSKGKGDPTVTDDARQLLVGDLDGIKSLDFGVGHRIKLVYLGKGKTHSGKPDAPEGKKEAAKTQAPLEGMDAFNLATNNEFRVVYSKSLLDAVGKYDSENGLDLGTPVEDEREPETGGVKASRRYSGKY